MNALLRLAYAGARAGAWFGGGLTILAAALIGVDIFLRKAFVLSIGGASELSGYVLAIGSAWGFALALLGRAHIRIDSLYVVLPTRLCAILDVLSLIALAVFVSMLTWQASHVFGQSYSLGSRALTPLATELMYPQFLWLAGLVYFLLVNALLLVRALTALVTGDIDTVQRIAGSRTALQEVREEIEGRRDGLETAP